MCNACLVCRAHIVQAFVCFGSSSPLSLPPVLVRRLGCAIVPAHLPWPIQCGPNTQVGLKALYEIAKVKNAETHSVLLPLESVCKSVRATALSMGLEIVDDRESLKQKNDGL